MPFVMLGRRIYLEEVPPGEVAALTDLLTHPMEPVDRDDEEADHMWYSWAVKQPCGQ
jgi:hypothetical protein